MFISPPPTREKPEIHAVGKTSRRFTSQEAICCGFMCGGCAFLGFYERCMVCLGSGVVRDKDMFTLLSFSSGQTGPTMNGNTISKQMCTGFSASIR